MALSAAAIAIKQGFSAGARSESKFLTRSSLMAEDTGEPVFFFFCNTKSALRIHFYAQRYQRYLATSLEDSGNFYDYYHLYIFKSETPYLNWGQFN